MYNYSSIISLPPSKGGGGRIKGSSDQGKNQRRVKKKVRKGKRKVKKKGKGKGKENRKGRKKIVQKERKNQKKNEGKGKKENGQRGGGNAKELRNLGISLIIHDRVLIQGCVFLYNSCPRVAETM